jgi:hypothetical protein
MPRTANNGEFVPKNPDKYRGKLPIQYRSSWELTVFNAFDQHPNVLEWASESLAIPYLHPFSGKMTMYIPDLLVRYMDKDGAMYSEVIEIKPAKEALAEKAKSRYDKLSLVVNQAKWKAAASWCIKNGLKFRILTEQQIYTNYK